MALEIGTRDKGAFKGTDGFRVKVARNHEMHNGYTLADALYLEVVYRDDESIYGSLGLGTAKKLRAALDEVIRDYEGELRLRKEEAPQLFEFEPGQRAKLKPGTTEKYGFIKMTDGKVITLGERKFVGTKPYWSGPDYIWGIWEDDLIPVESKPLRTLGDELDELATGTVIDQNFHLGYAAWAATDWEKRADGTWFAKYNDKENNAKLRENKNNIFVDVAAPVRDRSADAEDAQFKVKGYIRKVVNWRNGESELDFFPARETDSW